ncbi:MAG: hypothetical protein LBU21_08465 [Treponema sp.]|nr:hypothetical protein [Treponema sp.]
MTIETVPVSGSCSSRDGSSPLVQAARTARPSNRTIVPFSFFIIILLH